MLKIKLAAAILSLCAASTLAYDKPTQSRTPIRSTEKTVLKDKERHNGIRPKAPSRQVVTCEYDGAYLTFVFIIPEGECEATITETYSGASQTYVFDSSDLSADIYVGELYESTVTMTTAAGNTYNGLLTSDPE